MTTGTLIDRLV